MGIETDKRREIFVNPKHFGEKVIVNGAQVDAIFDNEFFRAELGDGVAAETREPQITVPEARVPGVKQGDPVTVRGQAYKVLSPEPDGTGMVVLMLERA